MRFFKMNGLGNDYIFLDEKEILSHDRNNLAKKLCNRHFGIGGDGIVVFGKSEQADIAMDIYNADGSSAELCGNALRCLVRYYSDKNLCNSVSVETKAGIKFGFRGKKGITVNLGRHKEICTKISQNATGTFVDMGNPHFVVVQEYNEKLAEKIGNDVSVFPFRTNVEFVWKQEGQDYFVRVYERGVGETLSCGTGACAVFCASRQNKINVRLPGGVLVCENNEKGEILQTGDTAYNFEGETELW